VGNQAPDLTPGDLPCLFERLWRKDRSRTDGDHSGLGLALARACSEAVGWRLEAELRDGRLQMTLKEKGE
jgi:signal transduction histidine kinase